MIVVTIYFERKQIHMDIRYTLIEYSKIVYSHSSNEKTVLFLISICL